MPRVPWVPPDLAALQLRGITRAIEDLVGIRTQEKNRQHALQASRVLPAIVMREVEHHLHYLQLRITAIQLITQHPKLNRRFHLMRTTPGIGETSALQILGELAVLPDTLDARQWVAFSGLEPRQFTSGSSVEKKPRISRSGSRHLRRALYMPALVAIRHEPFVLHFYPRLLRRHKAPLQAVVAVMRKLLHAFFAMFRLHQPYDGSKLCPTELIIDTVAACV